jgi:hypothetical protein
MTQANYTTDLTTLTQNETNTNVAEPTATGWTSLNTVASAETDYYIQNVACTSATIKVGVGGLLYNNGAGFTIPTDGAVLCWAYFWAPGVLDIEANGGARQIIGSALNAFYWVAHLGSDSWTYGGWNCMAMADPSAISVNTVGSPSGTRQYTGWAYNAPSSVPGKGNPFGIDAIRYGRATIQVTDGDGTEYGRFDVIAEFNDKNSTGARTGFTLLDSGYHRLGIFQYQDGVYKWQGHLLLGTAGVAVDFRDSNRAIFVQNTKHVTANFNLIEVRNAASRVDWTGISITKIGTVGNGRFLMTDNAEVNKDSCNFTDMDTFVYLSNATVLNTVYRRCGMITVGGATLTGCTINKSTASTAVLAATPAEAQQVSYCDFISDGTGYGMEITGTAADITLSGNTFTGYAGSDGTSGNEAIFVNIGSGDMTISIAGGGTIPSIRTAGANVNASAAVALTIEAQVSLSGAEVRIYDLDNSPAGSYGTELSGTESNGAANYVYSGTSTNSIMIQIMKTGYVEYTQQYTMPAADATLTVNLKPELNS